MTRAHRVSMTGAMIVCLLSTQWNATAFASENEHSTSDVASARPSTTAVPDPTSAAGEISERSPFTLHAEDFATNPSLRSVAAEARPPFNVSPAQFNALAGQIYQGQPYRIGHRDGSLAAIMIGSIAAIAGTAVLVYANRPECTLNQFAGGCGYGTKVVGGAVLSGGLVGLFVGALTWR